MSDLVYLLAVMGCMLFAGFIAGYISGETAAGNQMKELYDKKIRQMERRIMKKLGEEKC